MLNNQKFLFRCDDDDDDDLDSVKKYDKFVIGCGVLVAACGAIVAISECIREIKEHFVLHKKDSSGVQEGYVEITEEQLEQLKELQREKENPTVIGY